MYWWTRVGDRDTYHRYRSLSTAASFLRQNRVANSRVCWLRNGLATDRFTGCNYISLYPGDADVQPVRWMTDAECDCVAAKL